MSINRATVFHFPQNFECASQWMSAWDLAAPVSTSSCWWSAAALKQQQQKQAWSTSTAAVRSTAVSLLLLHAASTAEARGSIQLGAPSDQCQTHTDSAPIGHCIGRMDRNCHQSSFTRTSIVGRRSHRLEASSDWCRSTQIRHCFETQAAALEERVRRTSIFHIEEEAPPSLKKHLDGWIWTSAAAPLVARKAMRLSIKRKEEEPLRNDQKASLVHQKQQQKPHQRLWQQVIWIWMKQQPKLQWQLQNDNLHVSHQPLAMPAWLQK